MLTENRGASCENCAKPGVKNCQRCATSNGLPGWEPAMGVKVRTFYQDVHKPGWKRLQQVRVREVLTDA